MDEEVLKSKFLGALVGTGVGDALGAPFEGLPPVSSDEINQLADNREVLTYTDDTQMMIGVAESLLKVGGFDGKDMADTFVRNYERELARGYGAGTSRLFQLIKMGIPWDEAARSIYHEGSLGNGAAMRIAPVGVFYQDNPEMLKQVASQSSQITHTHPMAIEGAALQAYAIALATSLEPPRFNRNGFLANLLYFDGAGVYRHKLEQTNDLLPHPDPDNVVAELGNGTEAFNSVPTAVFCFLNQPFSFTQAVIYAIRLGGDTDTIGAMTGAISGAYLGVEAIPARLRQKLENRAYIEELAEKLWKMFMRRVQPVR